MDVIENKSQSINSPLTNLKLDENDNNNCSQEDELFSPEEIFRQLSLLHDAPPWFDPLLDSVAAEDFRWAVSESIKDLRKTNDPGRIAYRKYDYRKFYFHEQGFMYADTLKLPPIVHFEIMATTTFEGCRIYPVTIKVHRGTDDGRKWRETGIQWRSWNKESLRNCRLYQDDFENALKRLVTDIEQKQAGLDCFGDPIRKSP